MTDGDGLSLAVRLGALNDFLEPSQDCIVDLERPNLIKLKGSGGGGGDSSGLRDGGGGGGRGESALVNVSDCLACNGCVTTAETVLLNTHNYKAFAEILESPEFLSSEDKYIVLSLSAVVEASLIALWNLQDRQSLYGFLENALPRLDLICSCDLAEQLASQRHDPSEKGPAVEEDTGVGGGGVKTLSEKGEEVEEEATLHYPSDMAGAQIPPLISSHCPGVVLYAEKFEHHAIPLIDPTPPVQCWQGAIVKILIPASSRGENLRPASSWLYGQSSSRRRRRVITHSNIYHIVVNSCADKKLELFRPEFDGLIDLALTTDEFIEALKEMDVEVSDPILVRSSLRNWDLSAKLAHYFGFIESEKFNLQRSCGFLVARELQRNFENGSDPQAAAPPPSVVLRPDLIFWPELNLKCATGLRNLKNSMAKYQIEKLLRDETKLDLMACPKGGCFSGAGQAHIYRNGESVRNRAESLFTEIPRFGCMKPRDAIDAVRRGGRDKLFYYHVKETNAAANNSMNDW